jgi:glutaminyl-tRNA synthetase
VRLYDHLFTRWNPDEDDEDGTDWLSFLNPESLVVVDAKLEPSLAEAAPGYRCQFERQGYFCVDTNDSTTEHIVFNRTTTLRDTWARVRRSQSRA